MYYSNGVTLLESFTASLDIGSGKLIAPPARVSARSAGTAAWSLDGRRIAYLDRQLRDSMPVLFVRSDRGSDEREVPNPAGIFFTFAVGWSADGSSILVRGVKGNANGIFRVDPTTGEATLVFDMAGVGFRPMADTSGRGDFVYRSNDTKSIVRQDAPGGAEKVIYTSAVSTAFYRVSPDGRRLAFVEQAEKPVLTTVSTDGGPATQLWRDEGQGWVFPILRGGIAWSADGKFILFIRQKGDRGELWVVPADGGEARRTELTFAAQAGWLSVHPDGKRITYTINQSGNEYWVMNNFLPPPAK